MQWAWIPELPGRMAIGPAPGSHHALDDDLQRLERAGFAQIVCLIEASELVYLSGAPTPAAIADAAHEAGLSWLHLPVEDLRAPTRGQIAIVADALAHARAAGQAIYVHCMAGLGRAGTVAAVLLVEAGMCAPDAVQLVRWVRPGAIQSGEQERFIADTIPDERAHRRTERAYPETEAPPTNPDHDR